MWNFIILERSVSAEVFPNLPTKMLKQSIWFLFFIQAKVIEGKKTHKTSYSEKRKIVSSNPTWIPCIPVSELYLHPGPIYFLEVYTGFMAPFSALYVSGFVKIILFKSRTPVYGRNKWFIRVIDVRKEVKSSAASRCQLRQTNAILQNPRK